MSIRRFGCVVAGVLGLVASSVGCESRQSPLTYLPRPGNPAAPGSSGAVPSTPLGVTRLEPTAGFPGDNVRIEGSGFIAGTKVLIDGLEATFISLGDSLLAARVPRHPNGVVDVVVLKPDGQSVTLASAYTFEAATLVVSPVRARTGEALTVQWAVPGQRSPADWIALYKVGQSNANYDDARWKYTDGARTGTFTLAAPAAGEYEFRYLLDDDYIDVGRSQTITVQ